MHEHRSAEHEQRHTLCGDITQGGDKGAVCCFGCGGGEEEGEPGDAGEDQFGQADSVAQKELVGQGDRKVKERE